MKRFLFAVVTALAILAGPMYAQINPNQVAILRWYKANTAMASAFSVPAPTLIAFDGANMWVTSSTNNNVTKLRANDGANLGFSRRAMFPWRGLRWTTHLRFESL